MKQRWSRTTLVAGVVAAFSLLATINAYFFPFAFPDESEYWVLATNLAQSGILSFNGSEASAYRPPLLAWILAPLAAMGVPMAIARPVFIVFYAATGALSGYFLCRVFVSSRWLPPLGTGFVLSHPLYFFSAGNLYPQQVLTPLFLAALILACLIPVSSRAAVARSVGLGVLLAASMLASAPALFSLLPVFGLLAWEDWTAMRAGNKAFRLAVAGLTVVICMAPYLARNSRQVHPGLYLSLNSGINLLLGNSPRTTPTSGVNVDLSEYMQGHGKESEFEVNRRLTKAAVANIRQSPGYYTRLYVRKLVAGFGNAVQTVTHGNNKSATVAMWGYMTLVWIGTGIALPTFLQRRGLPQDVSSLDWPLLRKFTLLVLTGYFLTIAGYSIFFMRLRFRIPVDVALAVVAAAGWEMLRARLRRETSFTHPPPLTRR